MSFPSGDTYPGSGIYPGATAPGTAPPLPVLEVVPLGGPTTFTQGVSESLAAWNDPAGGWQNYNAALGVMFEQTYGIVVDQGSPDQAGYKPGWSVLLDPTSCPAWALSFCALFWGTSIPVEMDAGEARAYIMAEGSFYAGMPQGIIQTAQRFLTGSQYVDLIERTSPSGPDPYWFLVVVEASQITTGETWDEESTPWSMAPGEWVGTDQTVALTQALTAVKPVGVNFTLVETAGHVWSQATKAWSAETITWQQTDTSSP